MGDGVKIIDNRRHILKDDLSEVLRPGAKVSICAREFSMYGYEALRVELNECDEVRFLYAGPTFLSEKPNKKAREFYLPRLGRERSVAGTDLEIRLRNEMTQTAIARNCAQWMDGTARFRSFRAEQGNQCYMVVSLDGEEYVYLGAEGLTATALGVEPGASQFTLISRLDGPTAASYRELFDSAWNDDDVTEDVTVRVRDAIADVYLENSPELVYHSALHDIFSEFLMDVDEDDLPREGTGVKDSKTWNMLYDFQRDGALAIIRKLETYDGCILADSVGLGKTFTALSVIKYYESRNRNVLVLCPKKLSNNWLTYRNNQRNNPVAEDRFRYDVLYHTDLGRDSGKSETGIDLAAFNWGNYDLVVIDESHNFRNGDRTAVKTVTGENRYTRLMNRVILDGVHTKVLMLSATPVNNRFLDLKNQLELACRSSEEDWQEEIGLRNDIKTTFAQAQSAYGQWSKLAPDERTTQRLMEMLDPDFFKLLDQVTVARSRRQIVKYYDSRAIGPFPTRRKPISLRPKLCTVPTVASFSDIADALDELKLANYIPSSYLFASRVSKYQESGNLSLEGRETGMRRLMAMNLLKRLESSVEAFRMTVGRVKENVEDKIGIVDEFEKNGASTRTFTPDVDASAFDPEDDDSYDLGLKKSAVDLRDIDWRRWRDDMKADLNVLECIELMVADVDAEHDAKLLELKKYIEDKVTNPFNPGNRKVLVFTAMADTANYLYENLAEWAHEKFGIETGLVTGNDPGRCTLPRVQSDTQAVLECFSPVSKERDVISPKLKGNDIDLLIATDCISEGQNLQDCDCVVNYDIHWNPVRIIQRFGRVDRIGSTNASIQLVNFWPDMELDEYINLTNRVETRMKVTVMTSTGDDDLINAEETGDLEYRRRQLEQMQKEVVDLEDVSGGVSITDLGLDDFRTDLLAWVKAHGDDHWAPRGIHAVVTGDEPGIIFVLRNVNDGVNISRANRLHPFYLAYVRRDGTVVENQLQARETLQRMRNLCLGKTSYDRDLCRRFNAMTRDGSDMRMPSALLDAAVASMVESDRESVMDSFFGDGPSAIGQPNVKGLDDFELLDFLVVL